MKYKTEITQQQQAVVDALQYGGISSITIQCVDALIAQFSDLEKIRVRELIGNHPMPQTLFYNYDGQYWIDHTTFDTPDPKVSMFLKASENRTFDTQDDLTQAVKFAKSLPELGSKNYNDETNIKE